MNELGSIGCNHKGNIYITAIIIYDLIRNCMGGDILS